MLQSFAGGRLVGDRYGSGVPAVLALHGWRRTRADFVAVLGDLPSAALAVDLPGFGDSPPPPAAWGSREYASCLGEVLDQMAPQVVLLGHSFGGRVAVHLAAARPDRVAGLVLTGVPLYRPEGPRPRPAPGYRLVRSLARAGLVGPGRLEAARRRYGSADYRAAEGVVREVLVRLLAERYEEQIGSVRCPVELVWGVEDTVVPPQVAERAAAGFSLARLELLDGVDHFVPVRAPQALRAALLRVAGGAEGAGEADQ